MHSVNLGYALWACGSALELLLGANVWGGECASVETKAERAFTDFRRWAPAEGAAPCQIRQRHSQRAFNLKAPEGVRKHTMLHGLNGERFLARC